MDQNNIEFKAWNNKTKKWINQHEKDREHFEIAIDSQGKLYHLSAYAPEELEKDPYEICFYTGRQLGKAKLYAGDILKITLEWNDEAHYVLIKHSSEGTCFEVDASFNESDYDITSLGWALDQWENENSIVELVGNKFDDPELLEKVN